MGAGSPPSDVGSQARQPGRCLTAVPSLGRHPSVHDYYDPSDYLGGVPQDLDREELELEVRARASGPLRPVHSV